MHVSQSIQNLFDYLSCLSLREHIILLYLFFKVTTSKQLLHYKKVCLIFIQVYGADNVRVFQLLSNKDFITQHGLVSTFLLQIGYWQLFTSEHLSVLHIQPTLKYFPIRSLPQLPLFSKLLIPIGVKSYTIQPISNHFRF